MYKKDAPDGTTSKLQFTPRTMAIVGAATLVVTYGMYLITGKPDETVKYGSKYDPRSADDQHKTPSNDANAAYTDRNKRGNPLTKY
ncbi:hypothetical protein QBC46DRAFT_355644 [Diplogelasinospora grovesii]|uniref:Uncharacterized protein n=1 Tax=Diplogelasinospora grovesii TaxID=303347 RepID=A0AAN6N428_9PEZI|nr:hypothetical protein QBC46DRAFT_355644 [Diplogelasinospora grovesii]